MNLNINKDAEFLNGNLIYRKNEYSFDYEPSRNADFCLMIGNIYLGFNSESLLAQQIWGYNHYSGWISKKLTPPTPTQCGLSLESNNQGIESGVNKRLIKVNEWQTLFDKHIGWICIGEDNLNKTCCSVEFAKNIIAVLVDSQLKALWLKPQFINT